MTEANPPALAARATTDPGTSFNVGVQAQNSPAPMKFILYEKYQSGKMIVTNRTGKTNPKPAIDYRMRALSNAPRRGTFGTLSSDVFSLPNSSSCYLDVGLTGSAAIYYDIFSSYLQDVTNPENPIFNMIDVYNSSPDRLVTCSAKGKQLPCASDKWASMTFGLMNIGSRDLEGGLKAGESETLKDNGWNSGSYINYAEDTTVSNPLAVLFIQGSTDGSGFDAAQAKPSLTEVQSAPPCSAYKGGAEYAVNLKVNGTGAIRWPTNGHECTYFCRFTGLKPGDVIELTAVPKAGSKFVGWSGGGCSGDSLTCKVTVLSETSVTANFQ